VPWGPFTYLAKSLGKEGTDPVEQRRAIAVCYFAARHRPAAKVVDDIS